MLLSILRCPGQAPHSYPLPQVSRAEAERACSGSHSPEGCTEELQELRADFIICLPSLSAVPKCC